VRGLQNTVNSINSGLQSVYNQCPGEKQTCRGVPYKEYNRWVNEWNWRVYWVNKLRPQLAQAQSSLNQAQASLLPIRNELTRLNDFLTTARQSRQGKTTEITQLDREISTLLAQFDVDQKSAEEKKWKSRADVYMSQGLQDQQTMKTLVSSL
jgi:chromosome segregation ATPase